ncbi:MAG TPA: Rieske 2Fe-2S domain-containing protein [Solirubrobacterales bacterium]|nr:Rieske 2Fe-2S domain-containing protein [Solirubrobacterales bacterium]
MKRHPETATAALLFGAALAGLAFVAVYAFDGGDTQLLGVALALALGLVGAALILAAKRILPQEQEEEERPEFAVPLDESEERQRNHQSDRVGYRLREAGDGLTRRRLLGAAGAAAGLGLGAAALTPIASLGPRVGDRLRESPWEDGTPLVEENDLPVRADVLEVGSFLTAFAEGADKRDLATSVVVVRVEEGELELPPERRDWAPEGLLAFSKICTHAQCAISLFRYPAFPERSPGPALVCPCHYSTFDVLTGGNRIFGPAVRPLPQLPLKIEGGRLLAAGPLSGAVGASWGGVRES